MTDTAVFDATLADFPLGPDEWLGGFIVGLDESADVLAKLGDGGERGAVQGFSFQDRKPDLYLIKPGGPSRREVELHVGVTLGQRAMAFSTNRVGARRQRSAMSPRPSAGP